MIIGTYKVIVISAVDQEGVRRARGGEGEDRVIVDEARGDLGDAGGQATDQLLEFS